MVGTAGCCVRYFEDAECAGGDVLALSTCIEAAEISGRCCYFLCLPEDAGEAGASRNEYVDDASPLLQLARADEELWRRFQRTPWPRGLRPRFVIDANASERLRRA